MSCHYTLLPWLHVLWGEGNGPGMLPRGRVCTRSFLMRVFISLLQAETIGEVSAEDLNRIFIIFPGVFFQGYGLHWLVGTRAGGHYLMQLVLRQPWHHLSGFAAFLGLELKHTWGLDVIFREERSRGLSCRTSHRLGEERLPWESRPLFSQFCPLLGSGAFHPGDLLYLAHHPRSAHTSLTAWHSQDQKRNLSQQRVRNSINACWVIV